MRATARMVKKQYSEGLGCPPFFRLGSNAFPDIGSGGRTEKRNLKKITRSLGIGSPGTPGGRMTLKVNIHIFGLTKYTIYRKK